MVAHSMKFTLVFLRYYASKFLKYKFYVYIKSSVFYWIFMIVHLLHRSPVTFLYIYYYYFAIFAQMSVPFIAQNCNQITKPGKVEKICKTSCSFYLPLMVKGGGKIKVSAFFGKSSTIRFSVIHHSILYAFRLYAHALCFVIIEYGI